MFPIAVRFCSTGFIFSSLGAPEILLVLAAVLLLFGAEKLPGFAREIGRALNEMRRTANEFSSAIMDKVLPSGPNSPERPNRRGIEEEKREG
ncbi:MAG: twin-arginine translocase TatA/TatE family subunit [Kiritimatiellae bacterium]|jgi:TatA/E family protein of Tat protein translocase|nr:twin-arginine translocase TatA/TatE family subunit [Kiritimatiellia bacterium]